MKTEKLSKQMEKKKCPTENDVMKERLRVRKEKRNAREGEEGSQPNLTLAEKLMAARNMVSELGKGKGMSISG